MRDTFIKLKQILTIRERRIIVKYSILALLMSFIELFSLMILAKFISISLNNGASIGYLGLDFSKKENLIFLGVSIIVFFIFRSFVNIKYSQNMNLFTWGINNRLNIEIIKKFIYLPYVRFVDEQSSDLSKKIQIEVTNVTLYIKQIMLLISELIVFISLTVYLFYTSFILSSAIFSLLLFYMLGMKMTIFKKISYEGSKRSSYQAGMFKSISEFFGNFKYFKLSDKYENIVKIFANKSNDYTATRAKAETLSIAPVFLLQLFIFSSIIIMILVTKTLYENDNYLEILSIFALVMYRLAPSIGKIVTAYSQMLYYQVSVSQIYDDLNKEVENLDNKEVTFNNRIILDEVNFSFNETKILKSLFLTIKKGEKIGFVGESGSGKSTLIDIIAGLNFPSMGKVFIDDKELALQNALSWREQVGYIPQSIYLLDGTVKDNVVMMEEYDEDRLIETLKKANIYEFLKEKDGIDTLVGENGVKLSGGQKQRIGIARALYKEPEILILDEATSALDNETEEKIMEEIYNLSDNITLIIIAHRLNTLNKCDRIYKLDKGKIYEFKR